MVLIKASSHPIVLLLFVIIIMGWKLFLLINILLVGGCGGAS